MYHLFTSLRSRELFLQQLPACLLAGTTAEVFYTFHSFTLECAAFLCTWFVIDAALHAVVPLRSETRMSR